MLFCYCFFLLQFLPLRSSFFTHARSTRVVSRPWKNEENDGNDDDGIRNENGCNGSGCDRWLISDGWQSVDCVEDCAAAGRHHRHQEAAVEQAERRRRRWRLVIGHERRMAIVGRPWWWRRRRRFRRLGSSIIGRCTESGVQCVRVQNRMKRLNRADIVAAQRIFNLFFINMSEEYTIPLGF